MTTRRINEVDRMLAHEDGIRRVLRLPKAVRRRTVRKFGGLEVVIVEETGEPTKVYLANGDAQVVETTASELAQAASAVRETLANPPPIKRRAR